MTSDEPRATSDDGIKTPHPTSTAVPVVNYRQVKARSVLSFSSLTNNAASITTRPVPSCFRPAQEPVNPPWNRSNPRRPPPRSSQSPT
jgi:hypothetical protein